MALAEAILVCLADEPLTGYELTKTFQTSIGFFWRAEHQQIYRVLRSLKEQGLVTDEEVLQSGRPNKKIYSITHAGLNRLLEWSRDATPPASVKDDLMVRLYGLDHVDVAAVREQVSARLDHHRARLELYERIRDRSYRDVDPADPGRVGRLLSLQAGIQYERGWIEWCSDALNRLDRL